MGKDSNSEEEKQKNLSKELLESLIKESQLLDDYGDVVIGGRESQPEFGEKK